MKFEEVPSHKWVNLAKNKDQRTAKLLKVHKNDEFLVQILEDKSGYIRLCVNRVWCRFGDESHLIWQDGISWDELQEIKNALGYHNMWLVECYPPEKDLVNVANMRHLFLLKEPPEYGWKR